MKTELLEKIVEKQKELIDALGAYSTHVVIMWNKDLEDDESKNLKLRLWENIKKIKSELFTLELHQKEIDINTPFFGNTGAKIPTIESPAEPLTDTTAGSIYRIFKNTKRIHGKSNAIDWMKVASHKVVNYLKSNQ